MCEHCADAGSMMSRHCADTLPTRPSSPPRILSEPHFVNVPQSRVPTFIKINTVILWQEAFVRGEPLPSVVEGPSVLTSVETFANTRTVNDVGASKPKYHGRRCHRVYA